MTNASFLGGVAAAALLALGSVAEAAPFAGPVAMTAPANGNQVAESVFANAGLGTKSSWTFVAQPLTFAQGVVNATYSLKDASFSHRFGTASQSPYTNFNVIFQAGVDAIGSSKTMLGVANPFLFFFDTINQGDDNGGAYTDGKGTSNARGTHNIAAFLRNGVYALFYDDGGPAGHADDNDYNDMVVTVQVPEPATLALVGAGLLGLGFAARRRKQA